jgi:hypothetical protein
MILVVKAMPNLLPLVQVVVFFVRTKRILFEGEEFCLNERCFRSNNMRKMSRHTQRQHVVFYDTSHVLKTL